ncbi:SdiA-regulated domain-containing protein [Tamlana sp. 2201CG12-4]|uniref:SdiA-regulated domain-containing protein n=1 Tax=Tamlana sp. 2201CG12-4 TaxID=3112582 RepID=UPI002DBF2419|nr:SdiA-regulated domain-containing protein [Tamlana sp. 2201CG12-4]MEC3906794.1 SdiA-regulated domain-containing protein [Tamlana sp. 2201CG12-4]
MKILKTMCYSIHKLFLLSLVLTSCHTGKLKLIANLPNSLKEASAIEKVAHSDLLWTIEDSGNKNHIYGLDLNGKIVKDIDINNASNIDWEDLTSDPSGNLYIGDFGNNSKNRDAFTIYKITDLKSNKTTAEIIHFVLPKKVKPKDFEAFFLFDDHFYIFSKENKSSTLLKVPNKTGKHTAKLVTQFNLKSKRKKITSADISNDGKTVVLLTHDRLWKITNFESDIFFKGTIEVLTFDHSSQKEGICFKNNNTVYITDERNKSEGGNLYEFKL